MNVSIMIDSLEKLFQLRYMYYRASCTKNTLMNFKNNKE